MEITVKLIAAMPERSGVSQRGNAWKSREFVGQEITGQYPKKIVFEVYGEDNLNKFDLHANNVVKVSFDIDAHEWNGKWFNSVRAWKVEHCDEQGNVIGQQAPVQQQAQPAPTPQAQPAQQPQPAPVPQSPSSTEDNLPF